MKRTIFITGSTDGIGKLAALKLAQEGHEIYLHGRSPKKLVTVISEIKLAANNENISGFVADLADLEAVKAMGQQIEKEVPKIDVLINNAGVFKSQVTMTKEGLDMRFAVNYLAPYVLTKALVPLLQKGEAPRLINLSSAAQAPVVEAVLMGKEQRSEQATYAQSKLALTMWSFYLAKAFPNISTMAVNPGSLLNTNMVKEAYGFHRSSADKGADILYDLAVSKEYDGLTGKYFDNDRGAFGKAHQDAYDMSKIDRLIKVTENLLSKE